MRSTNGGSVLKLEAEMSISEPKIIAPPDFPDRLSPMLVKELRQGMRTNLFVGSFILLQVFMILCILMVSSDPGANVAANGFFWFFIYVMFIIVQPLRGMAALSSEYQANTMDLIQLTRLTSWRIAWGKWCAINAQTLLFTVSVLPYLVLRYFFGGIDVLAELLWLGGFAVASALLSSATVGCSAFRSLMVRAALLIGLGVGFAMLHAFFWELIRSGGATNLPARIALLVWAFLFGIAFFLLLGASRIGAASENYAAATRLLGLAFALGAWAFRWLGAGEEMCLAIIGAILSLTLIAALTEPPPVFQPVLRPFSKNFLPRAGAFFLTPGWHTALLFFIFPCLFLWLAAVYSELVAVTGSADDKFWYLVMAFCLPAILIFPLIPLHLFWAKTSNSQAQFSAYLFIQVGLLIITIFVAMALSSSSHEGFIVSCVPLPSVLFLSLLSGDFSNTEARMLIISCVWLALAVAIPLARSLPLFREMRVVFRRIREGNVE